MKRIPLLLSGADDVDYEAWPTTQGIAFADGELAAGTPVRVVDEDGRARPTQATCLATWNKDLKYVRWLLVDFQADLRAGEQGELFLEYGPEAEPPACDHPVRVEERPDENGLRLDTGALRLDLRRSSDSWQAPGDCDVFAGCQIATVAGWREVFGRDPGPFLYLRDQHSNAYDSCTRAQRPWIEIEDAGPLRASVCIRGYHATEQGQRFCPYILRLHVFAGQRDIRLYHTFVFDQEPHFIELAAIGVSLSLALGKVHRMAVAGAGRAHASTECSALGFLQSNDQTYAVTADGREIGAGDRTRGWALLSGARGSAVAVIRNAWQEYPKGFEVTPDGIDVRIWPQDYPQTLKFTTPLKEPAIRFDDADPKIVDGRDEAGFVRRVSARPTAPLNLKSLHPRDLDSVLWVEEMVEKHAADRVVSYNDTSTCHGIGAAKTTEIHLRFSPAELSDADAEHFAGRVQEPLIAPAAPAHLTATRALGQTHHAGDPRFARLDELLDQALYRHTVEMTEFCRRYGMMTWGNVACGHSKVAPSIAYNHHLENNRPNQALRWVGVFNNEACDEIMAVWSHFARTGRRDHFLIAQGYSRCVADVGFIHAHPGAPELVGLMHYHNAYPWSGGPSPSHSLVTGLLWDYYFTGNRRLLDVARENADWAVRNQAPSGIVHNPRRTLHREYTGPIWSLMEVYQATWEEHYGDVARRSLNWFWRTVSVPGVYPTSVYTRGPRGDEAYVDPDPALYVGRVRTARHWNTYAWGLALKLFDSRPLRDNIIAEADTLVWDSPVPTGINYMMPIVCLAYEITGDLIYAAYAKHLVENAAVASLEGLCRHVHLGAYHLAIDVIRLRHIVAAALEKDPEGLAEAEAEWQRRHAERHADPPVFTEIPKIGRAVSIGVLGTEDHPESPA